MKGKLGPGAQNMCTARKKGGLTVTLDDLLSPGNQYTQDGKKCEYALPERVENTKAETLVGGKKTS